MIAMLDLVRDHNEAIRARRRKRTLAWVGVMLAALLLSLCYGMLIAAAADGLVSLLTITILIWGFFGARHLLTRH